MDQGGIGAGLRVVGVHALVHGVEVWRCSCVGWCKGRRVSRVLLWARGCELQGQGGVRKWGTVCGKGPGQVRIGGCPRGAALQALGTTWPGLGVQCYALSVLEVWQGIVYPFAPILGACDGTRSLHCARNTCVYVCSCGVTVAYYNASTSYRLQARSNPCDYCQALRQAAAECCRSVARTSLNTCV